MSIDSKTAGLAIAAALTGLACIPKTTLKDGQGIDREVEITSRPRCDELNKIPNYGRYFRYPDDANRAVDDFDDLKNRYERQFTETDRIVGESSLGTRRDLRAICKLDFSPGEYDYYEGFKLTEPDFRMTFPPGMENDWEGALRCLEVDEIRRATELWYERTAQLDECADQFKLKPFSDAKELIANKDSLIRIIGNQSYFEQLEQIANRPDHTYLTLDDVNKIERIKRMISKALEETIQSMRGNIEVYSKIDAEFNGDTVISRKRDWSNALTKKTRGLNTMELLHVALLLDSIATEYSAELEKNGTWDKLKRKLTAARAFADSIDRLNRLMDWETDETLFEKYLRGESLTGIELYEASKKAELKASVLIMYAGGGFTSIETADPLVVKAWLDREESRLDSPDMQIETIEELQSRLKSTYGFSEKLADLIAKNIFLGSSCLKISEYLTELRKSPKDILSMQELYSDVKSGKFRIPWRGIPTGLKTSDVPTGNAIVKVMTYYRDRDAVYKRGIETELLYTANLTEGPDNISNRSAIDEIEEVLTYLSRMFFKSKIDYDYWILEKKGYSEADIINHVKHHDRWLQNEKTCSHGELHHDYEDTASRNVVGKMARLKASIGITGIKVLEKILKNHYSEPEDGWSVPGWVREK